MLEEIHLLRKYVQQWFLGERRIQARRLEIGKLDRKCENGVLGQGCKSVPEENYRSPQILSRKKCYCWQNIGFFRSKQW